MSSKPSERVAQRWRSGVAALSLWIGGLATVAMTALIVADVIGRSLGRSLLLANELSGYLLVALIFGGLAYAESGGRHVAITTGIELLPAGARRVVDRVVLGFATLFTAWLAWFSLLPARQDFDMGTRSIAGSGLPLWVPEALVPLGFALLAIEMALRLADSMRSASSVDSL